MYNIRKAFFLSLFRKLTQFDCKACIMFHTLLRDYFTPKPPFKQEASLLVNREADGS